MREKRKKRSFGHTGTWFALASSQSIEGYSTKRHEERRENGYLSSLEDTGIATVSQSRDKAAKGGDGEKNRWTRKQ